MKIEQFLNKNKEDLSEEEIDFIKSNIDSLTSEQKENLSDIISPEAEKYSVKATYDATNKIAIASTDVEDRHGESIDQKGWDLKNFKSNPVMLWAHNHNEIAVGNARNIHIQKSDGIPKLVFTPDFHEETPTAKALKSLYEQGRLNSFSVGFMPIDFDGAERRYRKQELLEISAVNVPANPDARMLAYKSLVDGGFGKDVAKDVTGIEEEEVKEEVDTPDEEKKSLVDVMKGALADEIAAEEEQKEKYKKMSPVHDIFWAFMDLYYDEETPVEDFDKLVGELIVELGKVSDGTYDPTEGDPTEPTEESNKVLDSISSVKEDIIKLNSKVDNLVKAQENKDTSAAPQKARAKQSLSKLIVKTSDKILEDKSSKHRNEAKIIKRAAEILIKSNKEK